MEKENNVKREMITPIGNGNGNGNEDENSSTFLMNNPSFDIEKDYSLGFLLETMFGTIDDYTTSTTTSSIFDLLMMPLPPHHHQPPTPPAPSPSPREIITCSSVVPESSTISSPSIELVADDYKKDGEQDHEDKYNKK